MTSRRPRSARAFRVALATLALSGPVLVAGCSDGAEADSSPEQVLAAAKTALDETSGVRLRLEVGDLPQGVDGLLSADGTATHDPAFDGSIRVAVSGVTADAAVIAADGKVFAILPFTTKFAEIDPADYSAPDPAVLMSTEDGLSSLLTSAEEITAGDQVRDGADVLATYTGVLAGDRIVGIIPSADPQGEFDATFTVGAENRLTQVVLTGPFYPDADAVTYTIDLADYGVEKDISAP